jgi:hypothetical protein
MLMQQQQQQQHHHPQQQQTAGGLSSASSTYSCACAAALQRFNRKLFADLDQAECARRCLAEPACTHQSLDDRYCALFASGCEAGRVHLTQLSGLRTFAKAWEGCTHPDACNYFPLATVDNGTACVFRRPLHDCAGNCERATDCAGVCGGEAVVDRCGVCGGDGRSCVGCMEPTACNYDAAATVAATAGEPGACVRRRPFHDCAGNCERATDCAGVCGGEAVVDRCGVCGGDSSSCDFGRLERSVAEAARRDKEARAARRAAAAQQREQIAQLEAQVAALTAALGDNDPTGVIQTLRGTVAGMKAQVQAQEAEEGAAAAEEERRKKKEEEEGKSEGGEGAAEASCTPEACHGCVRAQCCLLFRRWNRVDHPQGGRGRNGGGGRLILPPAVSHPRVRQILVRPVDRKLRRVVRRPREGLRLPLHRLPRLRWSGRRVAPRQHRRKRHSYARAQAQRCR